MIPGYQRALAASDPTRIDFHFYSIAGPKLADCLSTGGDAIFVPQQVSRRLAEDADLAVVLATCVAGLIEKQAVFLAPRAEGSTGVLLAGAAAGIVIPGAGLATLAGTSIYGEHLQEKLREQADRVALDLLDEAGLSPRVAPRAYQLAEAGRKVPKPNARLSTHASYLYQALAERDRRDSASAAASTGSH